MSRIEAIDVLIVTYKTRPEILTRLLQSLVDHGGPVSLHVAIMDNSIEAAARASVQATVAGFDGRFASLSLTLSDQNLGFGKANNALARSAKTPWLLLLNPDTALLAGALPTLLDHAAKDDQAAAFEFRQTPYEHPKNYHPISLETEWCSGAAVMFRKSAFDAVAGFEPMLFLYGEDVDLSWRLRARGYPLRYIAGAAVLHESYAQAGEIKPAQVMGSTLANVCLRARFGNWRDVRTGFAMLLREMRVPEAFPGRRKALRDNVLKALRQLPYWRRTRVAPTAGFAPVFAAWDFERRRKGAFFVPPPRQTTPKVSVLIRTHKRPQWLREALQSVERQSYPNVEIVVVEDGEPLSQRMLESEFAHLASRLVYRATGTPVGRARAGNLAMSLASGEWFNFLDDDDLFYADHLEALVSSAQSLGVPGVYGIAWETPTEIQSQEPLRYRESDWLLRFQMPFNHVTLWIENFMPIQTVLFHRRLYERHGGFAEDMDQLEDWNLWTRYTLEDRFELVDKTTSLYRVPACNDTATRRQSLLDEAYRDACARQMSMQAQLSPGAIMLAARTSHALNRAPTTAHLARKLAERFRIGRWFLRRFFAHRLTTPVANG